jgi:hypothetical protein
VSPRAQRTLLSIVVPIVVLGLAIAVLALLPNLNPELYAAILALALVAARAINKWIEDSLQGTAAPTLPAVNAAIQEGAATVPPPSIRVPETSPTLPAA